MSRSGRAGIGLVAPPPLGLDMVGCAGWSWPWLVERGRGVKLVKADYESRFEFSNLVDFGPSTARHDDTS